MCVRSREREKDVDRLVNVLKKNYKGKLRVKKRCILNRFLAQILNQGQKPNTTAASFFSRENNTSPFPRPLANAVTLGILNWMNVCVYYIYLIILILFIIIKKSLNSYDIKFNTPNLYSVLFFLKNKNIIEGT